MARPILVVKNIGEAAKRYTRVAKDGRKAVRTEFGIPFALQDIITAKPRAKSVILGVLSNGDRFNGQKLVRLLARTPDLTVPEVVEGVEGAKL
jgi:hypothetical protein